MNILQKSLGKYNELICKIVKNDDDGEAILQGSNIYVDSEEKCALTTSHSPM